MAAKLPLALLYPCATVLHFCVYRLFKVRRDVVLENLRGAFPDRSEQEIAAIAAAFYRNYSDVVVEMLRSLAADPEELLARISLSGEEEVRRDLESGNSVLMTAGHHCNLEWMLLAVCLRTEYPMEAIYRPLTSPVMEDVTTRAYTRFGGQLIPDRSVIKSILDRRDVPRIISIVSDQAPRMNDDIYWARFLGRETGFYMAPDTIARFTKYPVYFAGMRRVRRGHYDISLKKIAHPPYSGNHEVIAAYVCELERQILGAPEDWFWMHRRWKHRRSAYH